MRKRHPVPKDNILRFRRTFLEMVDLYDLAQNCELMGYISALLDALDRLVSVRDPVGAKNGSPTKQYIVIFKRRYLQLTDSEYYRGIRPEEIKKITKLVKRLFAEDCSVDEYLEWFFEDFLENNKKFCPPQITLACNDVFVEKFLFNMKDVLKARRDEQKQEADARALLETLRMLVRQTGVNDDLSSLNERLLDANSKYRKGKMAFAELRQIVKSVESEIPSEN